jgi:hypothetical protein
MYLLNIKIKEPRKLIGFSLSHEIIFLESGEGKTKKKKKKKKRSPKIIACIDHQVFIKH